LLKTQEQQTTEAKQLLLIILLIISMLQRGYVLGSMGPMAQSWHCRITKRESQWPQERHSAKTTPNLQVYVPKRLSKETAQCTQVTTTSPTTNTYTHCTLLQTNAGKHM